MMRADFIRALAVTTATVEWTGRRRVQEEEEEEWAKEGGSARD